MKVLFVDDGMVLRATMKECLEDNGYEVMVAVDGKDGCKKAKSFHPDAVITDNQMPEMSGVDLLIFLKQNCPKIRKKLLISVTNDEEALKLQVSKAGGDFLNKSGIDFVEKILEWLSQ